MSDTWIVIIGTAVVFILFAAVRLLHVEKGRRAIMSEAWRREQARRDQEGDAEAWKRGESPICLETDTLILTSIEKQRRKGSGAADDETKTLPVEERP